jgi:hypothetical protein
VIDVRISTAPLSRIQVTDLGQDLRDGQVCSRTIIANLFELNLTIPCLNSSKVFKSNLFHRKAALYMAHSQR